VLPLNVTEGTQKSISAQPDLLAPKIPETSGGGESTIANKKMTANFFLCLSGQVCRGVLFPNLERGRDRAAGPGDGSPRRGIVEVVIISSPTAGSSR
jgi:hypothetical protein